jgi:hypothetical protein
MSKSLSRHDEQLPMLRQGHSRESSHGVCTIVTLVSKALYGAIA